MSTLLLKAEKAKVASQKLSISTSEEKNNALLSIANQLLEETDYILSENNKDIKSGNKNGTSQAILDRLLLSKERIEDISNGLKLVINLPDPIGEIIGTFERDNGLKISKERVPLGVIGMIYEARPNVTIDSAGLALKTGNAIVLRGSSSALNSNRALINVIHNALKKTTISPDNVQLIDDARREVVDEMLKLNKFIDVIIPRGSAKFINFVVNNASVPVLETGAGNCHVYIDSEADFEMAKQITINSKTHRPSVCNAAESLLIDSKWSDNNIINLIKALQDKNVEIRGCEKVINLLPDTKKATSVDWGTEFLDYIMAVKIVDNVEEAINHINTYGTKHTEVIVTNNNDTAKIFTRLVDAAAVNHNASSRFTDGFEYGFGAEIGISTQKLHARGPMGLPALTSYKYIVYGNGQIK